MTWEAVPGSADVRITVPLPEGTTRGDLDIKIFADRLCGLSAGGRSEALRGLSSSAVLTSAALLRRLSAIAERRRSHQRVRSVVEFDALAKSWHITSRP